MIRELILVCLYFRGDKWNNGELIHFQEDNHAKIVFASYWKRATLKKKEFAPKGSLELRGVYD